MFIEILFCLSNKKLFTLRLLFFEDKDMLLFLSSKIKLFSFRFDKSKDISSKIDSFDSSKSILFVVILIFDFLSSNITLSFFKAEFDTSIFEPFIKISSCVKSVLLELIFNLLLLSIYFVSKVTKLAPLIFILSFTILIFEVFAFISLIFSFELFKIS